MIARLIFDPWQLIFPAIGFVLFLGVFVWVVIHAARAPRQSVAELERLPFDEETSRPASHDRAE